MDRGRINPDRPGEMGKDLEADLGELGKTSPYISTKHCTSGTWQPNGTSSTVLQEKYIENSRFSFSFSFIEFIDPW